MTTKIRIFILLMLPFIYIFYYAYNIYQLDHMVVQHVPYKWSILPTKLAIEYRDCTKDTVNIVITGDDVYGQRLGLNNGDLYYWMGHEETPNSGRNVLASYVKKYTILEQGRKEIIK